MANHEPKHCARSGCGKRLYANNTKGVCANKGKCAGKDELERFVPAATAEAPPKTRLVETRIAKTAASDALGRFRLLAEALGFDPEEVLGQFANEWLERARHALREPQERVSQKTREAVSLMLARDAAAPPVDTEDEDTRAMGFIRQTADMTISNR